MAACLLSSSNWYSSVPGKEVTSVYSFDAVKVSSMRPEGLSPNYSESEGLPKTTD